MSPLGLGGVVPDPDRWSQAPDRAAPPAPAPVFSLISDGVEHVAEGPVERFAEPLDRPEAVRALLGLLNRQGGATCVGAIPFDLAAPTALMVPERVECRRTPRGGSALSSTVSPTADQRPRSDSAASRDAYVLAVRRALLALNAGELNKVVLSRAARERLHSPVDVTALTRRLAAADARGHVFAIDLAKAAAPAQGPAASDAGHWFVGASPELLVRRVGRYVVTNPLAGSRPRGKSPEQNAELARALATSEKDRREHAFVVDGIRSVLGPLCHSLTVPAQPEVISTTTMLHLSTLMVGELRDPSLSSLELALALHPTPAVCGTPTARAARLVTELEGFDRGFFAGLVGWCNSSGDGCWVVSLRCGEVRGRDVVLYAGAGIVSGSDPEREYLETEAKLDTMRGALRAGDAQ